MSEGAGVVLILELTVSEGTGVALILELTVSEGAGVALILELTVSEGAGVALVLELTVSEGAGVALVLELTVSEGAGVALILELTVSEGAGVALVLEPVPISVLEHSELLGDQTGQRRSHHGAGQGLLGYTARPQVNVVRVPAGRGRGGQVTGAAVGRVGVRSVSSGRLWVRRIG